MGEESTVVCVLKLQDLLGGGLGEGLEVLVIEEVAIQSVLYLEGLRCLGETVTSTLKNEDCWPLMIEPW